MKLVMQACRAAAIALVPALTGCLTSRPPEISCWNLEHVSAAVSAKPAAPKFGIARVSQATVRAPYSSRGLAVLRADGTVAFDPYNEFAAGVAPLVKGVFADAMDASGLFEAVVGQSSSAGAPVLAEADVTRLALDCRQEGSRKAVAELTVTLVEGRDIAAAARGRGEADAADGDYGAAFSRALSAAFAEALGGL